MPAESHTTGVTLRAVARSNGRRELRIIFPALPMAVRDALVSTLGGLRDMGMGDDDAIQTELVMAEVFNNIAEHAYPGREDGIIELRLLQESDRLTCTVIDGGQPIPGSDLLGIDLPPSDGCIASLPEGGFGWYLIRTLTSEMSYTREGQKNVLRFKVDLTRRMRAV